jgi:hypothetical protein
MVIPPLGSNGLINALRALTLGLSCGPQETRLERTPKRALWAVCSEPLLGYAMPFTIQDLIPPPPVNQGDRA